MFVGAEVVLAGSRVFMAVVVGTGAVAVSVVLV